MSGIYIHIPFCKQACFYCNFHFSTSLKLKDEMIASLLREIDLHTDNYNAEMCGMILPPDTEIETLYFGGGTPSILPVADIDSIMQKIRSKYRLAGNAEVTLEANPDDISSQKLEGWKRTGINRLSVGIQSFLERDLKWMNRAHNAGQALNCLSEIKKAGFENYTIDLIFGIPDLTDEEWDRNIMTVLDAGVPHISCYALTVEPKTALDKMIRLGKKQNVNQENQARQFEILMKRMWEAGYEHYETSNFALPGFRSRHNSSYWQQKTYLGIGPSAHSYDGVSRFWNIANNPLYIKAIVEQRPFFEKEQLTASQVFNEYIMTSLRTMEGMDLRFMEEKFGKDKVEQVRKKIKGIDRRWLLQNDQHVSLSDEGILLTDNISVRLFD